MHGRRYNSLRFYVKTSNMSFNSASQVQYPAKNNLKNGPGYKFSFLQTRPCSRRLPPLFKHKIICSTKDFQFEYKISNVPDLAAGGNEIAPFNKSFDHFCLKIYKIKAGSKNHINTVISDTIVSSCCYCDRQKHEFNIDQSEHEGFVVLSDRLLLITCDYVGSSIVCAF